MSVLLELNIGDIVIDLHTDYVPNTCLNFLKLCKVKYYNFCPIYNVNKDFSFQTGDPIGPPTGDGGTSIWGLISQKPQDRYFPAEIQAKLKHSYRGTVSMAVSSDQNKDPKDEDTGVSGSQFFITLGDGLDFLDGRYTVFGRVAEGFDVLEKINEAICDDKGRPYKDIRIKHTIILDDPYPDPPGLIESPASPVPSKAQLATVRIGEDEDENEDEDLSDGEIERRKREREARANALTLEIVGDLPFAEISPPENILFVCKLNPATQDEDLELIFGRFGKILSCEVIRDRKSGDSLQYAFIEFAEREDAERAYFKMQDVLIDDKRIKVDFSQSTSKLFGNWRDQRLKRMVGRARGFGGAEGLEERRRYRDEKDGDRGEVLRRGNVHDFVFDEEELRRKGTKREHVSKRSKSPGNEKRGDHRTDDRGNRERAWDKDRERRRDTDYGRDRNRGRDRDRFHGYPNRDRR